MKFDDLTMENKKALRRSRAPNQSIILRSVTDQHPTGTVSIPEATSRQPTTADPNIQISLHTDEIEHAIEGEKIDESEKVEKLHDILEGDEVGLETQLSEYDDQLEGEQSGVLEEDQEDDAPSE